MITRMGWAFPVNRRVLLSRVGSDVLTKMREFRVAIMGGALTSAFSGAEIRDYDLYAKDGADSKKIEEFLDTICNRVFYSDNAVTFRLKSDSRVVYQVITVPELFNEGSYGAMLERFDFTICQAAYLPFDEEFMFGERFFEDLAQRRLVYNVLGLHPIATMFRVKKYLARGYTISGIDLIKLGLKIHSLEIPDYKTLRREILGVDLLFLKPLTDLMLSEIGDKPYDRDAFFRMLDDYMKTAGEWDEEML